MLLPPTPAALPRAWPRCVREAPALYRPRHPERIRFYQLLDTHFETYAREHAERFEERHGPLRAVVRRSVEQYLDCGRYLPPGGAGGRLLASARYARFSKKAAAPATSGSYLQKERYAPKKCCLPRGSVKGPHVSVWFEVPPKDAGSPAIQLEPPKQDWPGDSRTMRVMLLVANDGDDD